MKLNTIVLASLTGLLALTASAQKGGAPSSGAAGPGYATRPAPPPADRPPDRPLGVNGQQDSQPQPAQPNQPGQTGQNQSPQAGQTAQPQPQPQDPNQAAPNNQPGTATNSFANGIDNGANSSGGQTNQFGQNTNGFAQGNQFANTNQGAPTPTAQAGFPSRVFATNNNGTAVSNRTTKLPGDQAISQADRALLTQIRQTAFPNANAQAGLGGSDSVNFVILNGQVRLVGTVPTMEEKARIEAIAQQSPGVVKVFNALQVRAQ